jgi:hypothetical protein
VLVAFGDPVVCSLLERQRDVDATAARREERLYCSNESIEGRQDRLIPNRQTNELGKQRMNAWRQAVGYGVADYGEAFIHRTHLPDVASLIRLGVFLTPT